MSASGVVEWLLRTLLGGGGLLLLAWLAMSRLAAPARRQRLGEWALTAAVLLALLSLAPAWLLIDLPAPGSQAPPGNPLTRGSASPAVHSEAEPREPSVLRQSPGTRAEAIPAANEMHGFAPPEQQAFIAQPVTSADPNVEPAAKSVAEVAPSPLNFARRLFLFVAGIYLAIAGILFARWLLGHLVLARMLRQSEPVPPALAMLFASMCSPGSRIRLLLSRRVQVPFSCGLWRPTVVLPAALARQASPAMLRWIFAHELVHLGRGDAWSRVLFALGQALYFPLPWFWQLRRQVYLCQEYLADAAAAALGAPEDYAQFLLGWSAAPAAPLDLTGVSGSNSDLFRRVTMLLHAPAPLEPRCPRRWSLLTAGGLLTLAVFVAGIGPTVQAAPQKDDPKKEDTKKDDTKKSDTKKDTDKNVEEPKKDDTKKTEKDRDEEELVEAWLKATNPPGADEQTIKQRREQLERRVKNMTPDQRENLRRTLEQGKPPAIAFGAQPPPGGGFPGRPGGGPPGAPPGGYWSQRPNMRLGVRVESPSAELAEQLDLPKGQGLVVLEVVPSSAAEKAGLKRHDVILELNGKKVTNRVDELMRQVADIKKDTAVEVVLLRKGKKETIKELKLPEASAAPGGRPGFGPPGAGGGAPGFPGGPFPPGGPGGGFMPPGAAGGRAVVTTLIHTPEQFTLRHQEGTLTITLTGKTDDGKTKVSTIHINDGGQNNDYSSVDKVPERYRDKVKSLIDLSEKNTLKIESKPR